MKECNPLLLIEFGVLANKEIMDDFKKLLKKRKKKKKKKKKKKGKGKKKKWFVYFYNFNILLKKTIGERWFVVGLIILGEERILQQEMYISLFFTLLLLHWLLVVVIFGFLRMITIRVADWRGWFWRTRRRTWTWASWWWRIWRIRWGIAK